MWCSLFGSIAFGAALAAWGEADAGSERASGFSGCVRGVAERSSQVFSGAADEKSQTRVFVCTRSSAEAFTDVHSIAAMHASTTHARVRKRSSVATRVARAVTVFRV